MTSGAAGTIPDASHNCVPFRSTTLEIRVPSLEFGLFQCNPFPHLIALALQAMPANDPVGLAAQAIG